MFNPGVDYSLYVIIDRQYLPEDPVPLVLKVIEGGATVIQYRDKINPSKYSFSLATKLFEAAKEKKIPFVINDRVDIAMCLGNYAVHVGDKDMKVASVRAILPPFGLIGRTAHNWEDVYSAEREGANYVGLGPFFPTRTKKDCQEIVSREFVKDVMAHLRIPVVAVGGISLQNVEEVLDIGVENVAICSDIMLAEDPYKQTKLIKEKLLKAKERKRQK